MQTKIPCVLMRGGTSKGPFFKASDLPSDPKLRDQVLMAAMGTPDERQIDGVGGADPLTSKVAIVKRSTRQNIDLDYLFVQVFVDKPLTSIKQNCGNMLAGVGQFAIEQGLVEARGDETTLTIYMENSDSIADVTFPTPNGQVKYDGTARIDGVPGTSAPVMTNFRGTEGSTCGALLPTGNLIDVVNGIECTMIDNGMPCVIFEAKAVGRTGYETRDQLNGDTELKKIVEELRMKVGPMMNLGDVKDQSVPKMTLVSPARDGGSISTRSFIPHDCHAAIGVFAAVSVATACILPGTTANRIAKIPEGRRKLFSVEHPTGEMSVEMEFDGPADKPVIKRAALLRTARRLMEGNILVPISVWDGKQQTLPKAAE
jgi:4-oxalomesaconate tautomerase